MGGQWDGECAVSRAPSWSCLSSGGLASEKDYPFQGHQKPHRCLADKYKKVAWIQDFTMLPRNEQGMARVDMEGGAERPGRRQTTWLWETQLNTIAL